jgi:hypothetical protein
VHLYSTRRSEPRTDVADATADFSVTVSTTLRRGAPKDASYPCPFHPGCVGPSERAVQSTHAAAHVGNCIFLQHCKSGELSIPHVNVIDPGISRPAFPRNRNLGSHQMLTPWHTPEQYSPKVVSGSSNQGWEFVDRSRFYGVGWGLTWHITKHLHSAMTVDQVPPGRSEPPRDPAQSRWRAAGLGPASSTGKSARR